MSRKVTRVKIDGRWVPVLAERTVVTFSGGAEGAFERVRFFFWTAVGEDHYGDWKITGRARTNLSPADRFTRMRRESAKSFMYHGKRLFNSKDTQRQYKVLLRRFPSMQCIRAATYREVASWLESHKADAKFMVLPAMIQDRLVRRIKPV